MEKDKQILVSKVRALNDKLPEFNRLIDEGKIVFSERSLDSMTAEYNVAFKEWLGGATVDFVKKIMTTYKYFDYDAYVDSCGDGDSDDTVYDLDMDKHVVEPGKFVKTKKRRIIVGGLGSVWIDIELSGMVKNKSVTKWTRVAFHLNSTEDKWVLYFDPTDDELRTFDDPLSEAHVKAMKKGGIEVDLS